jgi:PTS system mannose-specific IIA component
LPGGIIMFGVVVITHGNLSEQLVATASMIMGESENVTAITFTSRDSLEELKAKATEVIDRYDEAGCLILTDLMGGSANNISMELMRGKNVEVVTGVNLPMLLEAVGYREFADSLKELASRVQASGIKSIINLKEFFEKRVVKKA